MPSVCHAGNAFKPATALRLLLYHPSRPRPPSGAGIALARTVTTQEEPSNPVPPPSSHVNESRHTLYTERHQDNINPDSLSETIEAHRSSNRESLIRKVARVPNAQGSSKLRSRKLDLPRRRVIIDAEPPVTAEADPLAIKDGDIIRSTVLHRGSKHNIPRTRRSMGKHCKDTSAGVLQYEGVVVPVAGNIDPSAYAGAEWPWANTKETMDRFTKLGDEVRAFYEYMRPDPKEQQARDEVTRTVQEIVSGIPDMQIELFGSERTGLSLATSDIDFRLMAASELEHKHKKAPNYFQRLHNEERLKKLFHHMREDERFILCDWRYARYPLIAMQHAKSGIEVQIVSSNDTTISRELTLSYLDQIPGLREIYSTLKITLDLRGLTDVFRGGLGSYSLFMLIVTMLRHEGRRIDGVQALGRNFFAILAVFKSFDTETTGRTVEPESVFFKKRNVCPPRKRASTVRALTGDTVVDGRNVIAVINQQQPYLMCLQDPADPFNDLGRKAYAVKHIAATLNALHDDMGSSLAQFEQTQNKRGPTDDEVDTTISTDGESDIADGSELTDGLDPFEAVKKGTSTSTSARVPKHTDQKPFLTSCIGAAPLLYGARRSHIHLYVDTFLPKLERNSHSANEDGVGTAVDAPTPSVIPTTVAAGWLSKIGTAEAVTPPPRKPLIPTDQNLRIFRVKTQSPPPHKPLPRTRPTRRVFRKYLNLPPALDRNLSPWDESPHTSRAQARSPSPRRRPQPAAASLSLPQNTPRDLVRRIETRAASPAATEASRRQMMALTQASVVKSMGKAAVKAKAAAEPQAEAEAEAEAQIRK